MRGWPAASELIRSGRLLVCLLVFLFAALPAAGRGETIRVEYSFPEPSIVGGKEFQDIRMQGLSAWGPEGAPALPCRPAQILLPDGARAARAEARASAWIPLPGRYRLRPVQPEHSPIDGAPPPAAPDPAIYGLPGPYPQECFELVSTGRKHGRSIAILQLYPVVYFPATGEVSWTPSIELTVVTGPLGIGALPPPRSSAPSRRAIAEEIDALVDNPLRLGTPPLQPAGGGGQIAAVPYAIITSPDLAPAFAPLAALRSAGGLPAEVFTTDWIYARYPGDRPDGGVDDATRIRNFIRELYLERGLRFVLLGGDADGDASCPGCEPVIVPTRQMQGFSRSSLASDLYFGCLDGSFDGDGDGIYGEPTDGEGGDDVDLMFEVSVGRAPVDSIAEAENFVRKTIAYERGGGSVLRRVLLVGEYLGFGGDYSFGGTLNDQIRRGSSEFIDTLGFENSPYRDFFAIETLYDRNSTGSGWLPGELAARIEAGVHIINHVGHADISNVMKFTAADIDRLSGNDYFIGYTQSCYAGSFDNQRTDGGYGPDSAVERFLGGPAGAVAFIANSRRGWAGSNIADGPSQRFNRRFWDAVFRRGVLQLGPANDRSREESIAYAASNQRARWCLYELNTLGDPALTLKLSSPRGSLAFEGEVFLTGTAAPIVLMDSDLDQAPAAADRHAIRVRSEATGDEEMVELIETGPSSGVFQGKTEIADGAAAADGKIQTRSPDTLIAVYADEDSGDGSGREVEARALAVAPLEIDAGCPPGGALGVPYRHALQARGGLPPYAWSPEIGYEEVVSGTRFDGLGSRQGWQEDEGSWTYPLPFRFPFYGGFHESVLVSSNGFLELGDGDPREFDNSVAALIRNARIAPLWADLVTSNGDIYIEEKLDSVSIRWRGTAYHTGGSINVEVELFSDGRIRFGYGEGNRGLAPTIGISAGDGARYIVSSFADQEDLAGFSTQFFPTRLPEGLAMDPGTGEISGVPSEVASGEVSFQLRDASGQAARKLCHLTIRPDGLAIIEPAAGELLLRGSRKTIRWEWFGSIGSNVHIDLDRDASGAGFPETIAARIPLGARSFEWTTPDAPIPSARIRIQSLERPEFFTHSGIFSVVGPTLIPISPAAGGRWIVGGEAIVRWQAIGDSGPEVRIDYNTDGSPDTFPLALSPRAPNNGLLRLPTPATPSETCRLRIRSLSQPAIEAVSPWLFSIRAPSLRILFPDGGECLRIGEKALITWAAEGDVGPQVILDFNTDGGDAAFPFSIGGGPLPSTGSFEWQVPDLPPAVCRLRIRSAGNPGISDFSSSPFAIDHRCTLSVLLWIPYIDIGEEQVTGTLEALRKFEPDLRPFFSQTVTPEALRQELADRDALIIVKQKQASTVDFAALGRILAPTLVDFLGRGGAVVVSQQTFVSDPFLTATGLMRAELAGTGTRLCELVQPQHPGAAGLRPNFAGPLSTSWYRVSGPGVESLVGAGDDGTVAAVRNLGFGRLTLAGYDYYNFNNDTARLLANAARVPLPDAGLRLVTPAPGSRFRAGEEVPIRWFARGAARGSVRIRYNTTGSAEEFPLPIAEVPSPGEERTYRWTAPPIPATEVFLSARIQIQSAAAPEHGDATPEPFFIVRPLRIETDRLPEGNVGLEYDALVEASGGVPPYSIAIQSLPAGLAARLDGGRGARIEGIPQRECERCEVEVVLTDSTGETASRFLPLPVFLRAIQVVHPAGDDIWLAGSIQPIAWSATGTVGETVNIRFHTNGSNDFQDPEQSLTITESTPVGEPFVWRVPIIDAPQCRIRVQSNEHPSIAGISPNFSISGPTLRLLDPKGGECWEPGKVRRIRWRSAGNSSGVVRLEYNTNGSEDEFPGLIEAAAPDTGETLWEVPAEITEAARVRVSFVESGTRIQGTSGSPFRIDGRCSLRALLWIPCPLATAAAAVIRRSLETYETDPDLLESAALDPTALREALTNRDLAIIPLMSTCRTLDYEAAGRGVQEVLSGFVQRGGVVVFCAPNALSHGLLKGLGLLDDLEVAVLGTPDCEVASYLHPMVQAIPLEFRGPPATAAYRISGGEFLTVIRSGEFPAAAARDEGSGRWVLLGFDYQAFESVGARVLVNAARMRPLEDGLRVISPMGGAVFTPGGEAQIRWAAQGDRRGRVRLAYNLDGSADRFPFAIAEVEEQGAGGMISWSTPDPWAGGILSGEDHASVRVQVEWTEAPELPARSEQPFFIVRERLSIATAGLADGHLGAPYESEVRIEGGVPPFLVDARDLPAGLFLEPPQGSGRITRIAGTPRVTISDAVVTLAVVDALGSVDERPVPLNIFPSRILLRSPAGGEYLLAGSRHEVRWDVVGYAGELVKIEYNLDGSDISFPNLAAAAAPTGEPFSWQVPEIESDACRLRITSNEAGLSGSSERTFAISGPRITCLHPNGEEALETGTRHTISWRSLGNPGGRVRIELALDGSVDAFPLEVAAEAPDTGFYSWTVPDLASDSCRLRIVSTTEPELADVSDGLFSIRYRSPIRGLIWIPYSGFDRAEVRGAIAAATLHEHDFTWTLSRAATEADLERELIGKETFVMVQQEPDGAVNFAARGRSLGPTLRRFVERGGAAIFLKQRGNAGDFLAASGLLDAREIGSGFDVPCRVLRPEHPLMRQLPDVFRSAAATGWYEIADPEVQVYAAAAGPVVAGKQIGDGRVVLIGFDYSDYTTESARVLANAVRMLPEDVVLPRFIRGDANADGTIDIADPVAILYYLFAGGAEPPCLDAADANDSATASTQLPAVDGADAVHLLRWLFLGGPPPPPPAPSFLQPLASSCGSDPQHRDGIDCASYPPCR